MEREEQIYNLELEAQEVELKIEELNNTELDLDTYEAKREELGKLKERRNEIIKEIKRIRREGEKHSKFSFLPKSFKAYFIVTTIFALPVISWFILPLWQYILAIFYNVGTSLLNALSDNSFLYYLIVGLIWFFVPIVFGIWGYFMWFKKEKTEDKKTFKKFYFIAIGELGALLIYQIIDLILVL